MDFFDNEYYGLIRNLMTLVGLWPYQKPGYRIVRLLCIYSVFILAFLIEVFLIESNFTTCLSLPIKLTTFTTHEYSTSLFLDVFTFLMVSLCCFFKYNVIYLNSNHIKVLFDEIQQDWNLIKDIDELEIIRKYADKIKCYTKYTGWIIFLTGFFFGVLSFLPIILDVIAPLENHVSRQLPIHVELFASQERYFYYVISVLLVASLMIFIIMVATETMSMAFTQHACGLFELISYRLTQAFNTCLSKTTSSKTKCKFYAKLVNAFITHQHCLEFVENMHCKFSSSYFVLCILCVASLSISMFRFLQAISINLMLEIVINGTIVCGHFYYIFWINYFGQDIIDHSESFLQQIYNTPWYTAPLFAQKLLLIALRRSTKDTKIIIGKFFVASFEGFASLISMSLSYCMVIYSVRLQ